MRVSIIVRRIREGFLQDCSDFLACWAFPVLAAIFPIAAGQWILRLGSRVPFLFREHNQVALAAMCRAFPNTDHRLLLRWWRLVKLMESSDWFRTRWFGLQIRSSDIEFVGQPLVSGPLLVLGLHWGCGFTLLRYFNAIGFRPRFVYRPINPKKVSRRPFLSRYYAWRIRQIDRVCNHRAITTGDARSKIEAALTEQGRAQASAVVMLPDAPYPANSNRPSLAIGNWRMTIGRGALEMAEAHPSRVLLATSTPDLRSGRIRLSFEFLDHDSTESASQQIIRWCEHKIDRMPWCWHLWHAIQ